MNQLRSIAVIGLGYVGLPVLVALSKKGNVVGYDYNSKRIEELKRFHDKNNEITKDELKTDNISLTDKISDLSNSNFFIVAVPTPVNDDKTPNLEPLIGACKNLSCVIKKEDIIVFESTVYPGTTEEVCIPVLEKESGLKSLVDFKVGYSPERINPGDKIHTFENISKVVSAQDQDSLEIIANVYSSVVNAEIFKAASIKTAEAAKIIENTQRDLNIALMNELALIFSKLDINTHDVLEAANTKWNFLSFYPGLVGGHCIGVDPYYLTYKAKQVGYDPEVILAGRNINDNLPLIIAEKIKETVKNIENPVISVLGLTFKENCPDTRNSKVFDIVFELQKEDNFRLYFVDPVAEITNDIANKGVDPIEFELLPRSDVMLFAVSHEVFISLSEETILKKLNTSGTIFDVKGIFRNKNYFKDSDINLWTL